MSSSFYVLTKLNPDAHLGEEVFLRSRERQPAGPGQKRPKQKRPQTSQTYLELQIRSNKNSEKQHHSAQSSIPKYFLLILLYLTLEGCTEFLPCLLLMLTRSFALLFKKSGRIQKVNPPWMRMKLIIFFRPLGFSRNNCHLALV